MYIYIYINIYICIYIYIYIYLYNHIVPSVGMIVVYFLLGQTHQDILCCFRLSTMYIIIPVPRCMLHILNLFIT